MAVLGTDPTNSLANLTPSLPKKQKKFLLIQLALYVAVDQDEQHKKKKNFYPQFTTSSHIQTMTIKVVNNNHHKEMTY